MADYTANAIGNTTASSPGTAPYVVMFNIVDTAVTNKSATNVDNIFSVLAGDTVVSVTAEVLTAEGAASTMDVGDGDDADGYIDGGSTNSAAWVPMTKVMTEGTPNTVLGYWAGKTYTANDTIDVKWNDNMDAAKVKFRVVLIRAQGPDTL